MIGKERCDETKIGKLEKWKEYTESVLFTVPAILLVIVMMYIPFIMSGYYSLTEWNGFVISLLLAVALTQKFKFANVFRGIFFIPHIMSMTIVGFIWKFIFTQGFARLYEMTGWSFWNESWLGSPDLAFYSVVFVGIWQALGFYIVLYIAGLQAVPADVPEAAAVDGAGKIQRFFKVTLPLLGPSFTTCIFMSLTNSLNVFDINSGIDPRRSERGCLQCHIADLQRCVYQQSVWRGQRRIYGVFCVCPCGNTACA